MQLIQTKNHIYFMLLEIETRKGYDRTSHKSQTSNTQVQERTQAK